MARTAQVNIALPPHLVEQLDRLAEQHGLTRSELARLLLAERLSGTLHLVTDPQQAKATGFSELAEECWRALSGLSETEAPHLHQARFTVFVFDRLFSPRHGGITNSIPGSSLQTWWQALTPLACSIFREGSVVEAATLLFALRDGETVHRIGTDGWRGIVDAIDTFLDRALDLSLGSACAGLDPARHAAALLQRIALSATPHDPIVTTVHAIVAARPDAPGFAEASREVRQHAGQS